MAAHLSTQELHPVLSELNRRLDPARRSTEYGMLDIVKSFVCADGLNLSVQGSRTHYCAPRDDYGPWHQVEVGFPSEPVEALLPYAEDPSNPTRSVYGWVPLEIVARAIVEHGGFAVEGAE